MTCHQTIVWLDAQQACILRMQNGLECQSTIFAETDSAPAQVAASTEYAADTEVAASTEVARSRYSMQRATYFHRVARALDIADEILVVGPSTTKLEFVKYMHKNEHAIDPRILGVETIGRPSDVELAAFAKLYFADGGPRRSGNGRANRNSD